MALPATTSHADVILPSGRNDEAFPEEELDREKHDDEHEERRGRCRGHIEVHQLLALNEQGDEIVDSAGPPFVSTNTLSKVATAKHEGGTPAGDGDDRRHQAEG